MASREDIKQALKILDKAVQEDFVEIKNDIIQLTSSLKKFLSDSEKAYIDTSANIPMVKSWYKFDDEFFNNLTTEYNPQLDEFVKNWLIKESDWKYPSCYIAPYSLAFVEHGLKSALTYVLTNKYTLQDVKDTVRKSLQKNTSTTLPVYRVNELDEHLEISDYDAPHGQIGTIICIDFLIYCAYEQLVNFISSLNKILRPGGKCLLHFTDADKSTEWEMVKHRKRTFCCSDIVEKLLYDTDLTITNIYKLNERYTLLEITKHGTISSQKISATKIEQVR